MALTVPAEDAFLQEMDQEELADLLIVSQAVVDVGNELKVEVTPARGEKCQRCWKQLIAVGTVKEHPTLCPRCAAVVPAVDVE